jgi:hypothetical protein
VDCLRLDGHTIFATVRGARDLVDRLPGADPFAGHGISPLAQPGNRCPRRVRKPSRRLGQIDDEVSERIGERRSQVGRVGG